MLHKDPFIIAPETFQLIRQLQAMPELIDFHLVVGTALALQFGHRNSIDIDLFTCNAFDDNVVLELINKQYIVSEIFRRKNSIICLINNIKTDFIRHDHPLLNPPIIEDGIRFLGIEDIAAMKMHAIIQSGKRVKDYIDIYFLLEQLSMKQIINLFSTKYTYTNPMIAMKAVNFFDDIDESIDPPKMLRPLPVEQMIARIKEATLNPDKVFKS